MGRQWWKKKNGEGLQTCSAHKRRDVAVNSNTSERYLRSLPPSPPNAAVRGEESSSGKLSLFGPSSSKVAVTTTVWACTVDGEKENTHHSPSRPLPHTSSTCTMCRKISLLMVWSVTVKRTRGLACSICSSRGGRTESMKPHKRCFVCKANHTLVVLNPLDCPRDLWGMTCHPRLSADADGGSNDGGAGAVILIFFCEAAGRRASEQAS